MGIYTGISSVARQVSAPKVGVSGVVREVSRGFCGNASIRRQFFGALEGLTSVEVRIRWIDIYDYDTALNRSNRVTVTTLAAAQQYGSVTVTITDSSIKVASSTKGKCFEANGAILAHFDNGREVQLGYLSDQAAKYGLTASFPIKYSISFSGSSGNSGGYIAWAIGQSVYEGNVSGSTSGTKTLVTPWTDSYVYVGGGITSGSGTQTTQMSFTNITIDGVTVPVTVTSTLT